MRGILGLLFLCVTLNLADGHHFGAIHSCREKSLSHGVLGVKTLGIAVFILSGIGSTFSGSAALQHSTEDNGRLKPLHWMHRPGVVYDESFEEIDSPKKERGSHSGSAGTTSHKKGRRSNHSLRVRSQHKKGIREGEDDEGPGLPLTGHELSDFNFRRFNFPKRGCRINPNGNSNRGSSSQRRGFGEYGNNGGSLSSIKGSAYDVLYETNGTPKRGTGYNVSYERNGSPKRGYGYDASYVGSPSYPRRGSGVKLGSKIGVYSDRGPGGKVSSGANSFSQSGPGGSAVSSASASSKVGPGGLTSSTVSAFSNSGCSSNSAVCG